MAAFTARGRGRRPEHRTRSGSREIRPLFRLNPIVLPPRCVLRHSPSDIAMASSSSWSWAMCSSRDRFDRRPDPSEPAELRAHPYTRILAGPPTYLVYAAQQRRQRLRVVVVGGPAGVSVFVTASNSTCPTAELCCCTEARGAPPGGVYSRLAPV